VARNETARAPGERRATAQAPVERRTAARLGGRGGRGGESALGRQLGAGAGRGRDPPALVRGGRGGEVGDAASLIWG
jgi:hypothetical protein